MSSLFAVVLVLLGHAVEAPPATQTSLASLCDVRVRELDGETLCSVHARGASVQTVFGEIAARVGRDVVGLDALDEKSVVIDAALDDRPLSHVVHTVLGAAGLRGKLGSRSIEIARDVPDDPSRTGLVELDEAVETATLRALKAHPEHSGGARAEMRLAEVRERRESFEAAIGHYRLVYEHYPHSEHVPDALLHAGLLLERARRWAEAEVEFTALANLNVEHAHKVRARLELARCMAHRGDGVQAIFMLDALDELFPAEHGKDHERLIVRARGLVAMQRYAAGLAALDEACAIDADAARTHDVLEIRAEALDHVGRPAEAARAWLAASRASDGALASEAITRAARSALAAGDDVAVLFIEELARDTSAGSDLDEIAREARARLGLAGVDDDDRTPAAAIDRARELFASGLFRQARQALEPILHQRDGLAERDLVDAVEIHARSLARESGLDPAIAELAAVLRTVADPEEQRRLFVCAGELYEAAGRYDDAARAYGGEL